MAAVAVAKYRGYEELLVSDNEDDDNDDSGSLVLVEQLPTHPKRAAQALEFALNNPPKLKDRAQQRQATLALDKLKHRAAEPPALAITDGSEATVTVTRQPSVTSTIRQASARSLMSRSELRTASSRVRAQELHAILLELQQDELDPSGSEGEEEDF